jgi:hypothetical protein
MDKAGLLLAIENSKRKNVASLFFKVTPKIKK